MARISETDLYAPVKALLERQGYVVKAEVGAVDVVGRRGDEPPVIVELKTSFSLTLLQQAVARLAITDNVYVCVPRQSGRASWKALQANVKLCRRLGIGVITVRLSDGFTETLADPGPYTPRKSPNKAKALLREFDRLRGDPNVGGATRQGIVTGYRQDAIACAEFLASEGPSKGAVVAKATGVKTATRLMADNHYGWFERVAVGIYGLTEVGRAAIRPAE